ncbi:MAG: SpoIIE family protein phosphatase [Acidimicrobiales bacterium]|nr:SpoIIE family protein phosphatase [Acidimicrobiales bacterium]
MSLRARLVLLCAFFFALAGGAAALGSTLILRANDARRVQTTMANAAQLAADLDTTYVGEAASIRSYFLSGDQASLDDYNSRRTHAFDVNGRLLGLVMDKPQLVRSVNDVTNAARAWRNDAILPLITLQQSTGQSQNVTNAYRDGQAVPLFQKIADNLSILRDRTRQAQAAAQSRESRTRDDVARFAVGSVAAAIFVIFALSLIARLWITRPLNQLARALKEPSDVPLRRKGPAEIASLTRDVEVVRDRARAEIEMASRTREGLAQNAALLMSIRAQLETSPDNLPPEWTVAAQLVPASGIVAGDCYNVDVLAREYLTIVVVDVAGHGAGSAVVALRANELLRAGVRSYEDPRDAVLWASALLSDLDSEMFVTAFVGRLHFETGLLRYVNAGHPAALICDGVNSVDLPPTGPLIGPFAGKWQSREAIVGPGQMLVCYTDGVVEVRDDKREEFGLERLRAVLRDHYGERPDEMVKQCLAEIDAFGSGRAHDDVTLTIIGRRIDG